FCCERLQPVPQSPIHDLRRDDVVARSERQKYGSRCRHPRREGEAGCAALEPGQQRFRLNECRVCRPAVGIAGPILVVGITNESGGRMQRRNERLGLFVDPSERLRGHCGGGGGRPDLLPWFLRTIIAWWRVDVLGLVRRSSTISADANS